MKESQLNALGVAGVILVTVGLPIGLAALPAMLGPEQFADHMPLRRPLRWEVQSSTVARVAGRDVLLVDAYGVLHNGGSLDDHVDRWWLVDRHTGEVLGRHTTWDDLEPVAFQGGRLWARASSDRFVALRLPDLAPEADLEEILDGRADLAWEAVDQVYFPEDSDNVRILAKDGFLWDLHPDLSTLTKLHHDTPVPTTPSLPTPGAADLTGEVVLPSGRIALLGTGSRRPALRVAEARGALETTEVKTPLDGFLDGAFLARDWQSPVMRPPEDVFVSHAGEDGGSFRLSRVSAREGLRWTRGEAEWLPEGVEAGAKTDLVTVEDRQDLLFLWLERTPEGIWSGADHFLVGVDPQTGDARWVTRF